jgi:hypothetical protein
MSGGAQPLKYGQVAALLDMPWKFAVAPGVSTPAASRGGIPLVPTPGVGALDLLFAAAAFFAAQAFAVVPVCSGSATDAPTLRPSDAFGTAAISTVRTRWALRRPCPEAPATAPELLA